MIYTDCTIITAKSGKNPQPNVPCALKSFRNSMLYSLFTENNVEVDVVAWHGLF